ncbi:MAG: hypothetical protein IH905_05640 [Proteobacteria bacterium]|nr:hypothetical protein [Pseudomonadota bacterium]
MSLVQKDYYSTQEALERVRLALPLEDAEQNLIEVLALGKCTAWFIDQAGERFDIPTELWEALLNHRSINRTYMTLEVDWETGKVLCLWRCEPDSLVGGGRRGLLRFDREHLGLVVKPSHPASPWDLLEEIRFEEAVCLWCEIEPYNSPIARRAQHPESVPVERFLLDAYKNGELPCTAETLKWVFSVKQTGLPDDNGAFLQKADLRKLAEQKGVRPRFLFPEGEQPAKPGMTRADHKRGATAKRRPTEAWRKTIGIIEDKIEARLTPGKAIFYFENEGISKESPRDFHPDFQQAYLVVDQFDRGRSLIHWTAKNGRPEERSLNSIAKARKALKSPDR